MKKLLLFFIVILFPILCFAQPKSLPVASGLSGNYIVGIGQPAPFNTITNAVAKINEVGVSGPVTFLLNDAAYSSVTGESFPIKIAQFANTSATNTLTIKPNVGKVVTITATNPNGYTGAPAVFQIDGGDNIIINGSNTSNGSSRNLTIINSDNIEYGAKTAIWISSNGSNGANNIKVLNSRLQMSNRNQLGLQFSGVYSGSNSLTGNNGLSGGLATAVNSQITIKNNEFLNVRQGIIIDGGGSTGLQTSNVEVSSNIIGSTTNAQKPAIALSFKNVNNSNILDNSINGLLNDNQSIFAISAIEIENSSSFTIKRNVLTDVSFKHNSYIFYGIHISGVSTNGIISENKISNIKNTGTGRLRAIQLDLNSNSTGFLVANNFISDISVNTNNPDDYDNAAYGIYITNGNGTRIFNNTVAMNANQSGVSIAIYFAGGTGFDVRNNIFTNTSSTGTRYAIYSAVGASRFTNINNNDYFAPKVGFLGTERHLLSEWQSATGKDLNSKNVNPIFVSPTDLHLQSVTGNSALDNAGANLLSVVPNDIDGVARTTTPDIGAAEFSAIPVVVPTIPTSAVTVEATSATEITLNLVPGGGENRLVVINSNTAVNAVPVDGTVYTANAAFGLGSQIGQGNYVAYAGNANTTTITGLSKCTTYYIAVYEYNGSGLSAKYLTTTPGTAAVGESTTFDIDGWSKGKPNYFTEAIITSNLTLTESLIACKLTVSNDAKVIVPKDHNVILNGAINVESGSFTFENNANLIQIADVQNTGNIVVKRNSSALKRLDYTLWSSPVSNQQLFAFSPLTTANRFYSYNSDTNLYNTIQSPSTTTFNRAEGYLIRMPNNHHATVPTIWNGTFTGVPHNGTITVPMQNFGDNKRFNLVGNPYPSPIDAKLFVQNSTNAANITGTLYFWRKTNDATQPSYYTWTILGLVAPITTDQTVVANNNNVIQTGQGFFVEAKDNAENFVFTNAMRKDDHANQFFKAANTTTEYNRIWLNATNAEGWFSQTLIGYFTDGSNDLDSSDGKYINDGDIAISSLIGNVPYAVQGKALPFSSSDVVPMYLKVKTAGNYTIAIDHVDGLFEENQDIFLRDNLTGILHDLKSSAYTFATEAGSFNARFEIVYQNPLAVQNPAFDTNSVVLYKKENNVVINSASATMDFVEVYDLRGRVLAVAKNINASEISVNVGTTNQVLIVKITSIDGSTITKKTIN